MFTLDSTHSETTFFEHPLVSIKRISENVSFLNEVLKRFADKEIMTLFVESGSKVHSNFINEGLADELYLYMASKLFDNGSSLFMNDTWNLMAESESLRFLDVRQKGDDFSFHARFLKED
ncbi:dihydrofolate reductase family protein [Sporosarcina sp. resist]|nr:dihydrofolate reductase family protein [Sporosarcina sp. resist]